MKEARLREKGFARVRKTARRDAADKDKTRETGKRKEKGRGRMREGERERVGQAEAIEGRV